MTSLVAREEIADELFRAGVKSPLIPRLLQVIDRYAITMAHHIQPTTDWRPDTYGYLGPGQTDITARVRRCLQCGKIKKLDTEFGKDYRVENGRRLRCITCSPPKRVVKDYRCPKCGERKPVEKFPEGKKIRPNNAYKCLMCS